MSDTLKSFKKKFEQRKSEVMTMSEYLKRIKTEPELYATPAERLLKAIGEPTIIDTAKDARLGRIHGNRLIRTYEPFKELYGIERVVEEIVAFLKHSAQNLEESKQILYLLGPVGSAKSTIAIILKELMEKEPLYILEGAPMQESPLDFFRAEDAESLGIPARYLSKTTSPWALKRLEEFDGDLSKFRVVKTFPSEAKQVAIGVCVAGDEATQDISTLVGKPNIRALEHFNIDDPDAYLFSGMLCHANGGIGEFIEMFKADPKLLHPLLTATQEKNFKGTEGLSSLPFHGIIMAHSNETEWEQFKTNKANEAFLDRVYIVKVPYCLRIDEEVQIYKKLIRGSELSKAPVAPGTYEMMAMFSVLSRLEDPESTSIVTKAHVYNGEAYNHQDPSALAIAAYQEEATPKEGFSGISTRAAAKLLSRVFNFDTTEIAANPVHLFLVLENSIPDLVPGEENQENARTVLNEVLKEDYYKLLSKDIQTAYLDSYHAYGQSLFDRYLINADNWIQQREYRDPETGQMLELKTLDAECSKLEKPAGISNPKDFRHEVVTFCLRYRSKHNNQNPDWTDHEQIRTVIEKTMFGKTEDLIPVISFGKKGSEEEEKNHKKFVERMKEKGYTEKQVRLVVQWQTRHQKSKE